MALQWSGRLGPTIDLDAASTTFVDLDITDEGRWEVDPNILNMFIVAAAQDIKYCPVIVAEPYDGVKACDLRLADDVQCCLFCDAVVPLRIKLEHVAEHIAKVDAVADARHRGKAEPYGFCSRSTGTCETLLNGTKVSTNCPYRYSFKYKKPLEKKRNVPRKCPVPMCTASPFTLYIKYHLRLMHPGLDPETIEVSDRVVEKQNARRARKTKAEKGEKVQWITIHVDKEAKEGMGQATTTGDEGGTNMAHNDLQERPMKIGVQSVARPMSQTGPTRIVRQRPISVVVGCPLHRRSLVPTAAVRTAIPKWSLRQDTRNCTRRPPSNPAGKANK